MATGATKPARSAASKPSGLAGWKQKAVHRVTLPSGMQVTMRLPNLAALIKGDALPSRLRDAAMAEVQRRLTGQMPMLSETAGNGDGGPPGLLLTEDDVERMLDLYEFLILTAVIDPKLEPEDLGDDGIPEEDKEMLIEIATRERDVDARGVPLGVVPLSAWDRFLYGYECSPGCQACAAKRAELSDGDG